MRHSQSVELGGSQDGGDDDGCPSLAKACLAVVVENFSDRPVPTDRLPSKLSNEIYSRLKDLDPSVGAQFVDDEKYWKRICHEKFGGANYNVEEHGLVWKQMFFELHLRTLLETYRDAGGTGLDELLDEIRLFQHLVHTLQLRRVPEQLPIETICEALPNLTFLDVQYGSVNASMSYDPNHAGMKLENTDSLGRAIATSHSLSRLVLTNSRIDDDMIRLLLAGLDDTSLRTLSHLDVSHNKITTVGIRLLGTRLLEDEESSALTGLIAADNRIRSEGGRALGRLLRTNRTLVTLDLRLNRLEDEGGRMLIEGTRENGTLTMLRLSSNSLASESALALSAVFEAGMTGLQVVDFSCNLLSVEDVERISQSLQMNRSLVCLDLRMNSSGVEGEDDTASAVTDSTAQERIDSLLRRNELRLREN